jgi:hypothetical protein
VIATAVDDFKKEGILVAIISKHGRMEERER